MKIFPRFWCVFCAATPLLASAQHTPVEKTRPADFVNIESVVPGIQTDMRYFSGHNFVGRRIDGYEAPVCLLTLPAAQALKSVAARLSPMGLALKIFDCYRPQAAVDHFARWARDIDDTAMRAEFYPSVDKARLFEQGYIDYRSGHSRGSTVDLTIVPASAGAADGGLDMGTGFDYFSPASHPDYQSLPAQARANRLLLRTLMVQAGFAPLETEWWHFTLIAEPYPSTYFDFPVS